MTRQQSEALFRVHQARFRRGDQVDAHSHLQAQLIFAVAGTMQLYADAGQWLLPPRMAVWAPASVIHRSEILTDAEIWSIYYDEEACRLIGDASGRRHAFVLRMTPLLHEAVRILFELEPDTEKAAVLAHLILLELQEVRDAPTFLPMPASTAGRRVAKLAMADHACRLDMAELAAKGATSPRTVSRLFAVETGLTFKAWRQRARIINVIDQLAMGATISAVTAYAGFNDTAALAHSFKQVAGRTMKEFVAEMAAPGQRLHLSPVS